MGLPSTQRAIAVTLPNEAKLVTDRPIPALRDHHVLVKVVSVALNPADWKYVDFHSSHSIPGALLGCDYSGIVEDIGKGVTRFSKGDHICGVVHGGNARQFEDGAFAEYIVVKDHLQIHKPKNLSFQEAATIGVGITTVGLCLYRSLKMNLPTDPVVDPTPILIYGGSTATGSLAIQFAKLSGYHVLTTCSPHNFDFVKSIGADVAVDYKDPKAGEELRKLTDDKLKFVLDNIANESTVKLCGEAISTEGGSYTAILGSKVPREDVKSELVLAYTAFGADFNLGSLSFDSVPEDKAFSESWWLVAEKLLQSGKIKVHPVSVREGGLGGVLDGFDLLRKDQVSGQKLVYNVSQAP